jgi:hypothetical protein
LFWLHFWDFIGSSPRSLRWCAFSWITQCPESGHFFSTLSELSQALWVCGTRALTVPAAIIIVLGVQRLIVDVLDIIGVLLGSPLMAALALPLVFGLLLLIQRYAGMPLEYGWKERLSHEMS